MSPCTKHRILDAIDGAAWGCILAWPLLVITTSADLGLRQAANFILLTLWWPLAWSAVAVMLSGLRKKMNDNGGAQ